MSYAEVTDVQGEFKDLPLTTTSAIKTATVERFLEEASALIDAKLGTKYLVPVDADTAIPILRMIAVAIVAGRIKSILAVKNQDNRVTQESGGMSLSDALDLLGKFSDGTLVLTGATVAGVQDGLSSFTSRNYVPKVFRRGETQW